MNLQRRRWLQGAAITAGALAAERSMLGLVKPGASLPAVTRVLLITKCHLDVGFTKTQQKVMQQYFTIHFPQAMRTAAAARLAGPDRYVWTTGSWLLYEYLEQASSEQRKKIETAVLLGDITWHALPFTWQTEMLDRSMIEGGLGFSAALDARFGRKTTGAKMTDVPGHTRGIVAPLRTAGVNLLDIGVNPAVTPPNVPDVFVWKDSAGNTVPVLYHRLDYGSAIQIPGTQTVIAVEVRGDNSGPHTPEEIAAIYARLRATYPGAAVMASNLNDAAAVVQGVRATLPVVTDEIGDTWIYGVASDPVKVSRFRAFSTLRQSWIEDGKWKVGDSGDLALLRHALLTVEHTWGTDTKTYLDKDHYLPNDLAKVIDTPEYRVMTTSWQEKRDDLDHGIATLPAGLRRQAETVLAKLSATRPETAGLSRLSLGNDIATRHFELRISPESGAMIKLRERRNGREWASALHPLALLTYQTLSAAQYVEFRDRYVTSKESWAPLDNGKPGIERFGAIARQLHPRLQAAWVSEDADRKRLLLQLTFEDSIARVPGGDALPRETYLAINLPHREPRIDVEIMLLGKQANRMPEAFWLTFQPQETPLAGWSLSKSGEPVALGSVIAGGGRAMHAATGDLNFKDRSGELTIRSQDAAMVAVGDRSPLNFSLARPATSGGLHYGLFNNAWGTNYLQWASGDWRFRFSLLTGPQ